MEKEIVERIFMDQSDFGKAFNFGWNPILTTNSNENWEISKKTQKVQSLTTPFVFTTEFLLSVLAFHPSMFFSAS